MLLGPVTVGNVHVSISEDRFKTEFPATEVPQEG